MKKNLKVRSGAMGRNRGGKRIISILLIKRARIKARISCKKNLERKENSSRLF
jgi:hypothetical protein